jgi:RNA polymerase sigma-70 factor (ECF subfamily)
VTPEKTVVGHSSEDQLIETYRPRVLYFALRRLRDRGLAEEVAQETVAAAVIALRENRLREPEKLPAFVFATARHLVQKIQREQARELAHATDSNLTGEASWQRDPDAALILEEERVQVRQALEQLNPGDRELLRQIYAEGESLEEIAKKFGIENAAVRQRKSRALERLRQFFVELSQKPDL